MKAPTIIVCLKTVPDPEGPVSAFEIHPELKRVIPKGIPPVISPYDETALEVALRLKARWGGRVVAINVSEKSMVSILRKALTVGADDLLLIEDPGFQDLTSQSTAQVLSAAIRKMGPFDLILTGRQAVDWDFGQVGLFLAELLKIPAVNLVQAVTFEQEKVVAEKLKRCGYEVVRTPFPALLTMSSEAGELRRPTLRAIQENRKKPVIIWKAGDLGIDPQGLKKLRIRELSAPPSRSRDCCLIEGESGPEKGQNLVLKLLQDRVLSNKKIYLTQ
jgi:electron transfer flavoprotein beta subunit